MNTPTKWMSFALQIPGLEIQRGTSTTGRPAWSVDHTESGVMVAWFHDPETAFKAATELAALADWTSSAKALQQQPGLAEQVWHVIVANRGSGEGELGVYQPDQEPTP
ncbi:MAG: hypothetical protein IT195_12455 [Microthrixaceae bacterium]|nr:hypothetical protein [Microthrixaceae bacterium]